MSSRRKFSDEYKREAVRLATEPGDFWIGTPVRAVLEAGYSNPGDRRFARLRGSRHRGCRRCGTDLSGRPIGQPFCIASRYRRNFGLARAARGANTDHVIGDTSRWLSFADL